MKKNYVFILIGILVLLAIGAFAYYKFYIEKGAATVTPTTSTTDNETVTTKSVAAIEASDLLNLMVSLEDDLGLQEVLAEQVEDIIVVKFKAPTISGEELNEALVQIFAYVDGKLPETIKKIRLVFVVNYTDSALVDLERSKITEWKAGKLDNIGLIKSFNKVSFLSESNPTTSIPTAYAQSEACPMSNSHQEGDLCICDQYYNAVSGQCVPMTDEELCPFPNTHRVESLCYCNEGFFPDSNGDCVIMSVAEICGTEHAYKDGDVCRCDEGYGMVGGKCLLKTALCEAHNAKYSASIDDCVCNTGYEKNAADDDCIPVVKEDKTSDDSSTTTTTTTTTNPPSTTTPTSTEPNPTLPNEINPNPPQTTTTTTTTTTTSTNEPTPPAEPSAPPISTDPLQLIINSQDNPDNKITVDPITSDLKPDDKTMVLQQVNTIQDFSSQDSSEVQLNPTTSQKIDLAKGIIEGMVYEDTQKWQSEVDTAAKEGKFKSESDKTSYEALSNSEKSYEEMYKQNVEALNIIHKQNVQIMNDEQAFSKVMWAGDKKFQDAAKRDFMKEANGDPGLAAVYATQAAAAQYKLLDDIKKNIRNIQEQKVQYLNVREKPNLEQELKKIKIDLYK